MAHRRLALLVGPPRLLFGGTILPTDTVVDVPSVTAENLTIVQALLDASGLQPPPEEVERLAELYGPIRRQLAMIHAADVGNVDPSNVFRSGDIRS